MRAGLLAAALLVCALPGSGRSQQPGAIAPIQKKIAWGKPHNGLEGGLAFDGGRSQFALGDTVKLRLYWRNVTKEPITISYVTHPRFDFRPTVTSTHGDMLPMEVALVIGLEQRKSVLPGEVVEVAQPEMRLAPPRSEAGFELIPQYRLMPGRYRVYVSGNEKDSAVPVTGLLRFELRGTGSR